MGEINPKNIYEWTLMHEPFLGYTTHCYSSKTSLSQATDVIRSKIKDGFTLNQADRSFVVFMRRIKVNTVKGKINI